MSNINGFGSNITGTTGSANTIEPKSGWFVYVLPRGAYAASAGSASPIVFDSTDSASRFSANDWIQIGTDTSKIRQVSSVAGTSIAYSGTAVSVALNDRIYRIGTTQPTVSSGVATYTPNTYIYSRDDNSGTAVTNSKLTTDSNGAYQIFAADGIYDAIVQDANGTIQGGVADIQIGTNANVTFLPSTTGLNLGSSSSPWFNIFYSGSIVSGITSAAGRTYHKFTSQNLTTLGNLWAFGNSSTDVIYGDTWGGVYHSYTLPIVINPKSAKYGAKGDGTTDDTSAIQSALNDAAATSPGGAIVFLPAGTYIISSQLTVKTKTIFKGAGWFATVLRAKNTFTFNGTTDSMIRLGVAGADAYCRVTDMTIDCNAVSGSIGVYSTNIQEWSGLRDARITNHVVCGFKTATGAPNNPQNFFIENVGIGHAASATTAVGMSLSSSYAFRIESVSIGAADASTASTRQAIAMDSCGTARVSHVHVERYATGILMDNGSNGVVSSIMGHNTVTTLLSHNGAIQAFDINKNSGTNSICDVIAGVTLTDNGSGFHMRTADNNTILTSSVGTQSKMNNHFLCGATLTVNGLVGLTKSIYVGGSLTVDGGNVIFSGASNALLTGVSVGGLTTLTLPDGYYFGISAATAIARIAPLTAGRKVFLFSSVGNQTFINGTSLAIPGGSNKTLNAGVAGAEWFCTGGTWHSLNS